MVSINIFQNNRNLFFVLVPSTCPNILPTDSSLSALWLLDGNAYDSMNNYNGTVVGRSSFITGYVGQAIALSNNSYIQTSYIDFYRRFAEYNQWPATIWGMFKY